MSGGMTERQIQLIEDFRPDAIMVTPSYMLTIVDAMLAKGGIDPTTTSLRTGVFGAEPWTEQMRRELEQQLGMDAVDIYGLSEVMGARGSRRNVWKPKMDCISGRITSIRRSSIR